MVLFSCRLEERLIFYPDKSIEATPAHFQITFEDVFFPTTDGIRLNGWFVPYPRAEHTLVWFHGNAGNISHRLENIRLLHEKVGVNIFIFDYRGYGRSQGEPSEEGTYKDGAAALEYLRSRQDIDSGKLIFFGRSLGAAVASELARQYECSALILETPFASIAHMARVAFPVLPIAPLLSARYDTLEKVRHIKSPLLVIHGDRDEVVPYNQGKEVFAAAPEPKEFYTIAGARHNDTYIIGGDPYFAVLKNFIERAPR
jgi:fermentation-respiration switch protein FrsA (DUF1100 family)